jgi:hypothetical protein
MAFRVYLVAGDMDALDTQAGSADRVAARPGTVADAWFQALDGRIVRIGASTCMTQVMGIHGEGSELWIQMACADNPELSLVLHIGPATRIEDVVERLAACPPTGRALQVISFGGEADRALADATALARTARLPH